MNMTKKKTALLALALIALVATVSAVGYFTISTYIHKEASVKRITGIDITVSDFPEEIEIGINYTFTTKTKNVLDHKLEGLVTHIVIAYDAGVELNSSWFCIYYKDSTWEGYIQNTFAWNGSALVSTAMGNGNWSAPVGYDVVATITFSIRPLAPAPLSDGTLLWNCWVEAPFLP